MSYVLASAKPGGSVRAAQTDYGREIMGAVSDEEAMQIAVDAVHESRAEQRGR
jgi:hypothetical protein